MTTRPHRPDTGSHETHDRLLIAARAAGDLTGRELDRAEVLLTACARCRALLGELRVIALATRDLTPAPRPPALDFRLTPDRAASLARGGWWRRFLGPFGSTGNGALRPLAAAFTTLGVAGLLLAALPMLPFGGAGTYQGNSDGTTGTRDVSEESFGFVAIPSGQPTDGPLGLKVQEPGVSGASNTAAPEAAAPVATASDAAIPGPAAADARAGDGPAGSGGPTPLVLLSVGFLGAGLGLSLLRRAALRLR